MSSDDSSAIVASGASAGAAPILLIYREALREGAADRYHRLEEDAAALCRSLRCPNPYLAMESLDAPLEVWFLNGFRSAAQEQDVARAYTGDRTLTAALARISTSKGSLTHAPVTVRTTLLESTHAHTPWRLGEGRFLVVATGSASERSATYIADDGSRFVLTGAQTEGDARQMAARSGPEARVFAVRPRMSLPAREWVDGDPAFWQGDPSR